MERARKRIIQIQYTKKIYNKLLTILTIVVTMLSLGVLCLLHERMKMKKEFDKGFKTWSSFR